MILDEISRGITKEMWTVVLPVNGGWTPTDIICNTESATKSMFDLVRRNTKGLNGGKVTKCIVTIYPPN